MKHAKMITYEALLIYPFEFVFAVDATKWYEQYFIVIIGVSLADKTFAEFGLLVSSYGTMHT